mmetsp:Transcript_67028/g.145713  ORF Transcript_67028/g.145713 Transcript_67028/m.145713 type:complete len:566 (-) Transcript_67028:48-1745(-)
MKSGLTRSSGSSSDVEELGHEATGLLLAEDAHGHGALHGLDARKELRGGGRGGLGLHGVQDAEGLLAHQVAEVGGLHKVRHRDVEEGGVGRVGLAVGRQALGDAHAGAVELADDPLVHGAGSARGSRVGVDEVGGPPERQRLVGQLQVRHEAGNVLLREVRHDRRVLRRVRLVEGVDGTSAAHRGDAAILWLLVDDASAGVADHVESDLSLDDARAEALVHELASGLLASLQVLARADGVPGARLLGAAVDAELQELSHGVGLGMVVAGLHQLQDLVVAAAAVPEVLAVVARLQLDDPDALARGASVLLDDARLEGHGLLEALLQGFLAVVGQGVRQSDGQVGDLAECVLGAHVRHHVWGGPDLDALLLQGPHALVELHLVSASRIDLAGVAADDDGVEALHDLEEFLVLAGHIVQQLAAHVGSDHAVGDGDAVVAVAAVALVGAAEGLRVDVDLHQGRLVLGVRGLRQEADIVDLCHLREAGDVHQGRVAASGAQGARGEAAGHQRACGQGHRARVLRQDLGSTSSQPAQRASSSTECHGDDDDGGYRERERKKQNDEEEQAEE